MKVKRDENMPAGLVPVLAKHGHDVATVPGQGLTGGPDTAVWEAVRREARFLITMDVDFAHVGRYPPGSHSGILILRPSKQGRGVVRALVEAVLAQETLESLRGCVAVADEHRIRVRR